MSNYLQNTMVKVSVSDAVDMAGCAIERVMKAREDMHLRHALQLIEDRNRLRRWLGWLGVRRLTTEGKDLDWALAEMDRIAAQRWYSHLNLGEDLEDLAKEIFASAYVAAKTEDPHFYLSLETWQALQSGGVHF